MELWWNDEGHEKSKEIRLDFCSSASTSATTNPIWNNQVFHPRLLCVNYSLSYDMQLFSSLSFHTACWAWLLDVYIKYVQVCIIYWCFQPIFSYGLTFTNRASYIYRTGVPLPSKCCILYIFSTNISTEYFKNDAHSLFFSSKCRLFYNASFFGSCIIHILHTGVLNLNAKLRCQKVNP